MARGLDRSVGDVVLVVVAGQRLSQYIAQTVGELGFLRGVWLDSSLRLTWLEDYAAALDQHATAEPPARLTDGIRFEHVSFRYAGADRLAVDDIDLHLPAGAVVAIVGENGAGKSTLIKLLAGMYRPTSGRITVDGVDLATMTSAAWRARLAGAFQDFFRFELVARQSVGVGDEPRLDDEPAVGRAVGRAGADDDVGAAAGGLGTQLGPTWEDGVEVSFGQWQKLALARGFMRDDPLVLVLDEPTAALDAETEHALFERYAEASHDHAANGRITLLVSHRFSTVRMADLIVVLDGARVVEVGRHDELVAARRAVRRAVRHPGRRLPLTRHRSWSALFRVAAFRANPGFGRRRLQALRRRSERSHVRPISGPKRSISRRRCAARCRCGRRARTSSPGRGGGRRRCRRTARWPASPGAAGRSPRGRC